MKTAKKRFATNKKVRGKGVILSLTEYQKLLEDLHDLAVIAERKDEPTISLTQLKKRLKRDGLL